MSDKSPHGKNAKKVGKSLKEKRADKKAVAATAASRDPIARLPRG